MCRHLIHQALLSVLCTILASTFTSHLSHAQQEKLQLAYSLDYQVCRWEETAFQEHLAKAVRELPVGGCGWAGYWAGAEKSKGRGKLDGHHTPWEQLSAIQNCWDFRCGQQGWAKWGWEFSRAQMCKGVTFWNREGLRDRPWSRDAPHSLVSSLEDVLKGLVGETGIPPSLGQLEQWGRGKSQRQTQACPGEGAT